MGKSLRGEKFAWGIPCGKQPAWEKISCGGDDRLGGTRRGKIPSEIGQKSNTGNSTRKKSRIGKMPRRKNPTRKKLTMSITNYVCENKCNKPICLDTGLHVSYRTECLLTVLQFPTPAKKIIQNRSAWLPRQTFKQKQLLTPQKHSCVTLILLCCETCSWFGKNDCLKVVNEKRRRSATLIYPSE